HLSAQNRFFNQELTSIARQVTRLASFVVGYNDAIAKAAANVAMPNVLLDARDEATRELSSCVGVNVVHQDPHSGNLVIGSGQPLVIGNEASSLQALPGLDDPSRLELHVVSGHTAQNVTSLLSGGELGGLLSYRRDVLDMAQNALGRMWLALASEFNQQL